MSSIFHGGNTYIFYNTDAGNNIPTAIGYKNIDELSAFPQVKINSSTTQLETYNDEWVQVLSGNMSIDSVSIVVHYVADNESHVFLDNAFTNQTNFQIKVSLYESQTSLEQHYVILSGYISAYDDNADHNAVYDRTYTFTAEDLIARGTATDPAPLKVGDFGVGADGETIPQYESSTPSGNSFIKVPALRSDNPLGIDMGGFAYVDNGGDQTAQFIISETGPLNLFIKNTNNIWTQLKTTAQNDQTYVPLTRTVNGKALSANIVLSSTDTGSLALTGGTLTGALTGTSASFSGAVAASNLSLTTPLSVSNGGTGATTAGDVRSNLSIYSKAEVDSTFVPKTTTVNGHDLSGNITVSAADVGLGTVLNAVQLVASNDLSDVSDIDTARTNISAAKSGVNSDITSITGLTTALSIAQGGTGNSTGLAASATKLATARTITTNLGSTTSGAFDGTANSTPGVSGILSIANGGTGNSTGLAASATVLATARTLQTNLASTSAVSFNGSVNVTPGVTGILPIANGGTGATTAAAAATALNLGQTSVPYFSSIELSSATPFIDFHYGSTAADYNVRLINDANNLMSCTGVFDAAQGIASRAGLGGARDSNVPFFFYWNYVTTSTGLYGFVGNTGLGNVSFVATSDIQLKKDIVYIESTALDEVKQWKPVTFKYKARGIIPESDTQYGFIANDLVKISPEVVKGKGLPDNYDIETDFNNPDAYNLDQVAMISKLTQAIQQQQILIEELQQQINK